MIADMNASQAPSFGVKDAAWRIALFGAMMTLGWPPLLPVVLLFLGFIPMLGGVDRILEAWKGRNAGRRAFLFVYLCFVGWNAAATWWVSLATLPGGVFAVLVNSLAMCLPLLLFISVRRHVGRTASYVALISAQLTFEYLHMRWEFTWPWLNLGNGLAMHPWLIQWYEYTGTSGGTFWLLGINILWYESRLKTSAIARAVQAGQASVEEFRSAAMKASLPAWAWMVLPAALSIYMYNGYGEDRGEAVKVALLQTDFDPHTEKFDLPWSTVLDSMVSQSGRALENAEEPVDLLVWPETAVTYAINLNNLDRDHAMRVLQGLQSANPQTSLLVGMTTFQRFDSPEGLDGDVVERFYSSGKKVYELRYNTAMYMDSTGQSETYFKGILVPGPERYPYREQLKFLDKVLPGMKNYMGRLSVSRERSALGEGNRELGPAICYESIFGEFMTGFVEDGAKLLFVITNDGWWGNSNGRKQHLAYARLRAIETRRNVARSANTGISCFIDQRGEVVSAVPVNSSAVLMGTMYANDELTTFVRVGDVLGRTSLWITMLALLLFIARRQMSKSVI